MVKLSPSFFVSDTCMCMHNFFYLYLIYFAYLLNLISTTSAQRT